MDKGDDKHDEAQIHFEDNGNFDRSWREEKWGERSLGLEAQQVYIDEKELGPLEAIRCFPKAILWSLVMSTCVIMEGYDTNLLGNFFAYRLSTYPAFLSLVQD
jgi:SP family general alpha glucoside:H+ symporter-like MFS transporter